MSKNQVADYLQGMDGVVIGLEPMDDSVLAACPDLKIAAKYGVGLDNLELDAFEKRGVKVGWTGGVNRASVAEEVVSFMIALSRNLFTSSLQLKAGTWHKDGGLEIHESTIGIIGIGHIGKELIRILKPFGCKILVNDIIEQDEYYQQNGVTHVSKEEMYKAADIISYHVPLTELTEYMVCTETLKQMKSNCIIINTARGKVVKADDLKLALQEGTIKAAAIDVYEEEPPKDQEYLSLPNLFCTPHVAGNSRRSIHAMGDSAIDHLRDYFIK